MHTILRPMMHSSQTSSLILALILPLAAPCMAGVWAHYSFDTDFNDSSGNNRHGTLVEGLGIPTTSTAPNGGAPAGTVGNSGIVTTAGNYKFGGGAMSFSTDRDYVSLDPKTFGSTAAYTIAFWAKVAAPAAGEPATAATFDMVIGDRSDNNNFIGLGQSSTSRFRGNGTGVYQQDFKPTGVGNVWHHYAFVADGTGGLTIYFDGLATTYTGKNTHFLYNAIGDAYSVNTTNNDFDFHGEIDEVWILDEAADATVISQLYTNNSLTPVDDTDPSVTTLHVVLVGGQSNADGRAVISELPTSPVNLQQPQSDVDFFYRIEGGASTLTTLRPGLSETSQFGPSVVFGRKLADLYGANPNTRVALVKYANGGTNLHTQWKSGGNATTAGEGPEYVAFQETVSAGLARLAQKYPNATVLLDCMLWVQGESDADSDAHATAYQVNLTNFIADVRATLGAGLPFIISRLSDGQTNGITVARRATIQSAQDSIAASDPRTSIINTNGFGLNPDNLHYNGAGQQALGAAAAIEAAYHAWVISHFTSAQIDAGSAEPTADPDGDGHNNHEEFIGASDPHNSTSQFRAWISLPDASTPQLNYSTSRERSYMVEQFDAAIGKWLTLVSGERGNGTFRHHDVSNQSMRGIYRVLSALP